MLSNTLRALVDIRYSRASSRESVQAEYGLDLGAVGANKPNFKRDACARRVKSMHGCTKYSTPDRAVAAKASALLVRRANLYSAKAHKFPMDIEPPAKRRRTSSGRSDYSPRQQSRERSQQRHCSLSSKQVALLKAGLFEWQIEPSALGTVSRPETVSLKASHVVAFGQPGSPG